MDDEYWTTRDGRRIAVGEMTEEHVRNTLRMILRKRRRISERTSTLARTLDEYGRGPIADRRPRRAIEDLDDYGDGQDFLNAQYQRDLANPHAFFPLLEGGVYGSPGLAKKYNR
jgi:hypothetical protein